MPRSVSGQWVARATRPCRSATRRPEERGAPLQKARIYCLRALSPFRPAGRRAVQATGLRYRKTNFRTRSKTFWPSGLRRPRGGQFEEERCQNVSVLAVDTGADDLKESLEHGKLDACVRLPG